jgi:hypothetical protein
MMTNIYCILCILDILYTLCILCILTFQGCKDAMQSRMQSLFSFAGEDRKGGSPIPCGRWNTSQTTPRAGKYAQLHPKRALYTVILGSDYLY